MNYGVLKGTAHKFVRDDDSSPHSELLMHAVGTPFRVAVNVRSTRGAAEKRLVEYVLVEDLKSTVVDEARRLPLGWNDLDDGNSDGAAVDYIRSNLFRATDMRPLIHTEPGPENDLFEAIEALFERAIREPEATVYAFGDRWGPEAGKKDAYFDFVPGNGVHNVHMNQGGGGDDAGGTFQDGALILDFPSTGRAVGLFLKFQNQTWHTSEEDGTPLVDGPVVPEPDVPDDGPVEPWPVVAPDSPYHLARIVAAMVKPRGEDVGAELVTVLNISDKRIDLKGWSILDRNDRAEPLAGSIEPGHAVTIRLTGSGAQLSNKGGTISLLDAHGLKVDGVAYTKDQVAEGRPVVFV